MACRLFCRLERLNIGRINLKQRRAGRAAIACQAPLHRFNQRRPAIAEAHNLHRHRPIRIAANLNAS